MYCAHIIVLGQCLLACGGPLEEFKQAWGVRWDNAAQAIVDDHGPLPSRLYRRGTDVIWTADSEPFMCAPVPQQKPNGH